MNRNVLSFIALAITICYGAGFAAFRGDVPAPYAALGGALVALAWIAVGVFGRDKASPTEPGPLQDEIRR